MIQRLAGGLAYPLRFAAAASLGAVLLTIAVSAGTAAGQSAGAINGVVRTGSGNLSQSEPLLIVDGVVLSRFAGLPELDLDPAEIESIEILKGAAAAAAHGTAAAGGVLAIATKRAEFAPRGEIAFQYRVESGFDQLGRQLPLTRHHHYRMSPDGTTFVNAAAEPVTAANAVPTHPGFADIAYPGRQYDQVAALFEPGRAIRQKVMVSRNGPSTTFLLTLNRVDHHGAAAAEAGWRNQGRFTFDQRIGDRLRISVGAMHLRTEKAGQYISSSYASALKIAPFIDVRAPGVNERYLQIPDTWAFSFNPLWLEWRARADTRRQQRTLAGATLQYNPFLWLALSARLGYDGADDDEQWRRVDPVGESTFARDWEKREVSLAATSRHQLGDFRLLAQLSGGDTRETAELDETSSSGGTLISRDWSRTEFERRSYMVSVSGDYGGRYYVDALIRRDSVSSGGPRWRTHYRAAASYRITAEPWFRLRGLDELVLRYGYGTAGEDVFLATPTESGAWRSRPYVSEHEAGVRALTLHRRLAVDIAYARRSARDDRTIAVPSGFLIQQVQREAGGTVEATLQARVADRPNLEVNVAAVMDRSHGRITGWNRACFTGDWQLICEGAGAADIWVRSLLRSHDELPAWLTARSAEFQVNDDGYLVWVGPGNTYRDGVAKQLWGTSFQANGVTYRWGEPIQLLDSTGVAVPTNAGSALPDLSYGFITNVAWRHVALRAEVRGQIGGKIYNSAKQELYRVLRHADIDQAGRPDELKKPVAYYRSLQANGSTAHFVETATYLRVGALSAQYRFDRRQLGTVLGRFAPRELSLELTGRNLLTFTGYSGVDPEAGSLYLRVDPLLQPQLRTITATAQLHF